MFGETANISEWCDFDFYDRVWYFDKKHPNATEDDRKLGRWLGVLHRVVSDLCYWILTPSGQVISRSSVQHVTRDDYNDPDIQKRIKEFDRKINEQLGDKNFLNPDADDAFDDIYEEDIIAHGDGMNTPTDEEYGEMLEEDHKDIDEIGAEAYDKFIGAEVVMDLGDQGPKKATVKQRARDRDDNLIGRAHKNPLLDTREYEIEFEDGTTDFYLANVISENLYSQVDSEGCSHLVFQEIINHRSNPKLAVSKQFGYTIGCNGNKVAKKTT